MPNRYHTSFSTLINAAVLTALLLLAATPAAAQWQDTPFIYFDTDYNQTYIYPDAFPCVVEGYLVLNNPTASGGVGGWEGRLVIDGPAQLVSTVLAGQALNGLTPPEFWVGVGDPPLPGTDQVLLATFQFLVSDPTPVTLTLEPIFSPSLPGEVSYLNGDGSGQILPMVISPYEPLGRIGCTPECGVYSDVNFQEVGVGLADTSGTFILNYQFECRPLHLDVGFADPCPDFFLTDVSGPTENPYKAFQIPVGFAPMARGYYECQLVLGDICRDVVVSGVCRDPLVGEDHLGVFFDPHFTDYGTYAPGGSTVTAHLVLLHPSATDGLNGWEACISLTGGAQFGAWDLRGLATNTLEAPCFRVVMDSRLNAVTQAVELATFEIILPPDSEQGVQVLLGPVPDATLPGQMSWVVNTDQAPIVRPLSPYLDGPAVAWLNEEPVAVTALTPSARIFGGLVTLIWPAPRGDFDDCRVYRRQDAGPEELVASGVQSATGGGFIFRDDLGDRFGGATLHYSYALLKDGREVARSPEVDVAVTNLPAALTRLLPAVPNPFNPRTEIRFETKEPGAVRVTLHDVGGRLVRTLVDEDLSAGPHHREWFGQDDQGRPVPSGAYYIRLETGSRVDHGKVMLLK